MILVQDQYSRKNFETEKQDASKPLFLESKKFWELESDCQEILTSENDSEGEDILYEAPLDLPEELYDPRRVIQRKLPKNVRFEESEYNHYGTSGSSVEDFLEYADAGPYKHRRSLSQEPQRVREPKKISHKSKWCQLESCCERRPKSSPEKISSCLERSFIEREPINVGDYTDPVETKYRLGRHEHRCGRHHDFDCFYGDTLRKKHSHYKFEHGDDFSLKQRHGDCSDCYSLDDGKCQFDKSYLKMKPVSTSRKPKYPERKIRTNQETVDSYYSSVDRHFPEYGLKGQKKVLEAVQEQQEQLSDSTYKIPGPKFSSQTAPGEVTRTGRKPLEKPVNCSQSEWLYDEKIESSLKEKLREVPSRVHKMRSRRTRMNRLKNGWKKAFVQTVRDGARNERVGVLVMGAKGPEFYSKEFKKSSGIVPFRKSKSFMEGTTKSFEVMTVDCKNVFLSSSEPGPSTNFAINDLVCPEDDTKVEETIAKFSKNVNDIVKNSEEKFFKALSNNEFQEIKKPPQEMLKGAGEGTQLENETKEDSVKMKFPLSHLTTFQSSSPRLKKSPRDSARKVSEESKTIADVLNEKAKQYKETHAIIQEKQDSFIEDLKEFQENYQSTKNQPPETNSSYWGMKLKHLSEKNNSEGTKPEDEVKKENEVKKSDDKEKLIKDEISVSGSVKSIEQIILNKQRRKKYYESTTSYSGKTAKVEEGSCAGDAPIPSDKKPETETSKANKCNHKLKKWSEFSGMSFEDKTGPDTDPNVISAVLRDLVENGCSISPEESENLQSLFNRISYRTEVGSNDAMSSSCSEEGKANVAPDSVKCQSSSEETKENDDKKEEDKIRKKNDEEEVSSRKISKMKSQFYENASEEKNAKKAQKKQKDEKCKKICFEDKMKLLREALPSLAAENEAAHLKQLKKYIDRFIDRVEASTTTECKRKKETRLKPERKDSASTDSGEIRVDARKILDFVNNPFKKISSDVTINIAKKLTDALVQDKSCKAPSKLRRNPGNETDEDGFVTLEVSSGSERCGEPEPTYLKQLKKMRNEHLNNIVLEVKRLSELLRFLDRCNRLNV